MGVSPAVSPPPGNPRFPLFDSLRAIALFAVIFFHIAQLTGGLFTTEWGKFAFVFAEALSVFFVISGFLLYRPFAAARLRSSPSPGWTRFLRRRALRIIPAYWVALTLLAIWPGINFDGGWWIYYSFSQAYSLDHLFSGISVAWSLTVELGFYLLLPLWAAAMVALGSGTRRSLRPELAILIGLVLVQIVTELLVSTGALPRIWHWTLPGRAGYFAIGMGLALASIVLTEKRPAPVRFVEAAPGLLWLGAGACFVGLGLHLGTPTFEPRDLDMALGEALREQLTILSLSFGLALMFVLPSVFGDTEQGLVRRLLALGPLSWVGVVSYSAYLYHYVIAALIIAPAAPEVYRSEVGLNLREKIPDGPTTLIFFVLTVAATLAVAAISYRFVELPFLRRKEPGSGRAGGGELAGERAGFGG